MLAAGDLHQLIMHIPLRSLVHTLIDLVNQGERSARHFSQRHEVGDGGE